MTDCQTVQSKWLTMFTQARGSVCVSSPICFHLGTIISSERYISISAKVVYGQRDFISMPSYPWLWLAGIPWNFNNTMWHFWCLMTQRVSVKPSSVTLRHITSICFDNHWWGSDRAQGDWHWVGISCEYVACMCVYAHRHKYTASIYYPLFRNHILFWWLQDYNFMCTVCFKQLRIYLNKHLFLNKKLFYV